LRAANLADTRPDTDPVAPTVSRLLFAEINNNITIKSIRLTVGDTRAVGAWVSAVGRSPSYPLRG